MVYISTINISSIDKMLWAPASVHDKIIISIKNCGANTRHLDFRTLQYLHIYIRVECGGWWRVGGGWGVIHT